jgi:urea transport system permease protein
LSEQFPQVWLFFQGALFLIVVTVLPSGVVGWIKEEGIDWVRSLFGKQRLSTYPSLEMDPDVQYEQQNIRDRESDG